MKITLENKITLAVASVVALLLAAVLAATKRIIPNAITTPEIWQVSLLAMIITYLILRVVLWQVVFKKLYLLNKLVEDLQPEQQRKNEGNVLENMQENVIEFSLQKVREIDRLQKLEQYRKEFLGNVSHELKTPIFNIQGYLETLLDGAMDEKKILREYLQKASANAERLNEIVSDLLQISQYEAGEMKLDIDVYDIRLQAQEVMESFALQAKARQIDLRFREQYNEPLLVEADKTRIGQVFYNLLSNAIKYNNENSFVSVAFSQHNDTLLVEISDNGPGIAQEHLARLFERFYRVDKARSRDKGGTGLGLAIVKHIMEAHKQTISVTSTVGVGTSFTFSLKQHH